jgi:hypothetical protein
MRTDCGGATASASPVTSSVGHAIRVVSAGCAATSASQLRAYPSGSCRMIDSRTNATRDRALGTRLGRRVAATTSASAISCIAGTPPVRAFSPRARIDARAGSAGRAAGRKARGCAPRRIGGREVRGNDRPHRVRDDMAVADRERGKHALRGRCETLDRERTFHARGSPRAGKIYTNGAIAGKESSRARSRCSKCRRARAA